MGGRRRAVTQGKRGRGEEGKREEGQRGRGEEGEEGTLMMMVSIGALFMSVSNRTTRSSRRMAMVALNHR